MERWTFREIGRVLKLRAVKTCAEAVILSFIEKTILHRTKFCVCHISGELLSMQSQCRGCEPVDAELFEGWLAALAVGAVVAVLSLQLLNLSEGSQAVLW